MSEFQSICPDCRQPVPAAYLTQEKAVYLVRYCPTHGESRVLASDNAEDFKRWISFPSVTVPPRVFLTKGGDCPFHCGPCENHLMTACCVLLNVTDRCNQHCPYCFAEAGETSSSVEATPTVIARSDSDEAIQRDPSLVEIERWLNRLVELGEERKFNIQLSGGEPTMREDLPEIIGMCKHKGFEYVQLNTNGRKIAEDPDYAKALKAAGLSTVFMQFDGVTDDVYVALRGEPLFDVKKTAVQNCAEAGLPVTLVPTILKSVNLNQTGAIIDFMLENIRTVKGVHFQPASFFGRKPDERNEHGDYDERVTMFAVMDEIEKQTCGRIKKADLAPISTGHPLCCFCAAYMKEPGGELRPLSSGGSCCDPSPSLRAERSNPELDPLEIVRRDRDFVLNKWEVACCGSEPATEKKTLSLDEALAMFKSNMFTISGMAFMDETNLDAERLKRCRVQVFSRDERLVPFCSYYSYRRE